MEINAFHSNLDSLLAVVLIFPISVVALGKYIGKHEKHENDAIFY